MGRPRARDYGELRLALLEAAARILTEEGPQALSTRRVATEVGVSTTGVYSLFGDKNGLMTAVYLEGFTRLGQALTQVRPGADSMADLIALGHAYRANARANPHLYELMFGRPTPGFTPDAATIAQTFHAFQPLIDAVTRCITAGVLAADDPLEVAVHLHALVHGLASLELRGALATDPDRQWQICLTAATAGYRPNPPKQTTR